MSILTLSVCSCEIRPLTQRPEFVLVSNPGFEAPKEDWIQDWDLVMGERSNAARDSKIFHTGSASLRLSGFAWVGSRMLPYNGEEVNLSAWVRTLNVKPGKEAWARPGVSINGYDEARRPVVSRDLIRLDGTRPWQNYQLRTVLSSAVRFIRVMCFMDQGVEGTAWFDDVDLTLREWRDPAVLDAPYDESRCTVEIFANKPLGPLKKVWSGADAGLAEMMTLEPVRSALPRMRAAGVDLLRFREIINGLKIYSETAGGKPVYDWSRFDKTLELPVKLGFRPVVVLGTTPDEIAVRIGPRPWRNISPPKDLHKWGEVVYNIVRHCEEKFGKAAVENWYWEVWNEPDSPQFFQGSQADYFALYDYAAEAVKRANPRARVGGPASSTHAWVPAFAAHCAQGRNAMTGKTGAPVDFFSWHIYTTPRGPAAIAMLDYSIGEVRSQIDKFLALREKEFLITQWNLSPPRNDLLDTHYAAAFVARGAERLLNLGVAGACFFCVADNPWSRDETFKGDPGLVTSTGIDKPVLNVFRLLHMLGPIRLTMRVDAEPISGIASATEDGQRIDVLLSNYVDDPTASFSTETNVNFIGLSFPPGELRFRRYLVDASRSNAYDLWLSMGSPSRPTALEIRTLRNKAQLEIVQEETVKVADDGTLSIRISLPEQSVTLIELERTGTNLGGSDYAPDNRPRYIPK